MQSQNHNNPQPWLVLTAGFLLGRTTSKDLLEQFYYVVDYALVPLYTVAVVAYLSVLVLRKTDILSPKRISPKATVETELEEDIVEEGEGVEQPIDLSGRYKLVSVENFDAFLEVQGVPWALRKAACKARPIHKITHRGNRITIRIEGLYTTQTTYMIGGPSVEISIRGRLFQDKMMYLENGQGIRGIKKAVTEKYDVIVDRIMSPDKQKIMLTGKAVFQDERPTIESVQIFERIQQ